MYINLIYIQLNKLYNIQMNTNLIHSNVIDEKEISRHSNTTYFYTSETFSTLTWFYYEPRQLKQIKFGAMPFILTTDTTKVFLIFCYK